jgi:thiol-disulfide isomerase/thioredoxin
MSTASAVAHKRGGSIIWILIAAGAIALFIVAIVLTRSQPTDDATGGTSLSETRAVTVTGDSLPTLPADGEDPAVGMSIAEITGKSFDGTGISVTNNGLAKVLLVGAHWCPHCQVEIPIVQQWIDQNGMPDNVELVALSTAVDSAQPNYPPSEWLEAERWTSPVMADDESGAASAALGTSGFPFFVFVNADGTVHSRFAGELPIEQFASTVATLSKAD